MRLPPQIIETPVDRFVELDPAQTRDCEPRYRLPQTGSLPVQSAADRQAAVEDALAQCRNQLAVIRATQEKQRSAVK